MSFGTRLRDARKEKKLTQKELASKIGAAHNSVSNWENDQNKPDPDTIQNLCWVLGVQPNYFFGSLNTLPPEAIPYIRGRRFPIVGDIPAGIPILAEENIEGYEYADVPEGEDYFFLRVKGESIITINRDKIYKRFAKMCKDNNLPHLRFHDLRHANASVMLAMGVPDKYAMERMGHATNNMLKTVYQHTMSDKMQEVNEQVNSYFSDLISHDISHEN